MSRCHFLNCAEILWNTEALFGKSCVGVEHQGTRSTHRVGLNNLSDSKDSITEARYRKADGSSS